MIKYMFLYIYFLFQILTNYYLYYVDSLAKLVEYGDENDDSEEPAFTKRTQQAVPKPFWAV